MDIENNTPREAFVYVIGSNKNGRYKTYVGWTYDITHRIQAHNSGKGAKSTKGRYWQLIYFETLADKQKAMSREWYIKRDKKMRSHLLFNFKNGATVETP